MRRLQKLPASKCMHKQETSPQKKKKTEAAAKGAFLYRERARSRVPELVPKLEADVRWPSRNVAGESYRGHPDARVQKLRFYSRALYFFNKL